jgi:hypothetical protein
MDLFECLTAKFGDDSNEMDERIVSPDCSQSATVHHIALYKPQLAGLYRRFSSERPGLC